MDPRNITTVDIPDEAINEAYPHISVMREALKQALQVEDTTKPFTMEVVPMPMKGAFGFGIVDPACENMPRSPGAYAVVRVEESDTLDTVFSKIVIELAEYLLHIASQI